MLVHIKHHQYFHFSSCHLHLPDAQCHFLSFFMVSMRISAVIQWPMQFHFTYSFASCSYPFSILQCKIFCTSPPTQPRSNFISASPLITMYHLDLHILKCILKENHHILLSKPFNYSLFSMEPWAVAKKLSVSVVVPPAPVRVPSQSLLAPNVANDKGGNEMILGVVHRSPGICLTAEENPRKPQLRNRLMKGCANSHRLKWGPFPPNEVGRIAQHVRKGEGRN